MAIYKTPRKVVIVDPVTGTQANVEQNGGQAINIQDQHTDAFDLYFSQDVGSPTTLTTNAAKDAYVISVTTGHGLVAEDDFILFDLTNQRGFTGQVVSVAGDNTVNLDRPLNFSFPSATTVVQQRTSDLAVDGSGTPQIFSVGGSLTEELDVTRLMMQMTTTAAMPFSSFGDIAGGITRGVQCRVVNGLTHNLWNAKTNAEWANLMYDITVYVSTGPQAVNGLIGRMTYAGQSKHGVTLRIGANESIQIIIQDDLTSLLTFRIIAAGHIVTD